MSSACRPDVCIEGFATWNCPAIAQQQRIKLDKFLPPSEDRLLKRRDIGPGSYEDPVGLALLGSRLDLIHHASLLLRLVAKLEATVFSADLSGRWSVGGINIGDSKLKGSRYSVDQANADTSYFGAHHLLLWFDDLAVVGSHESAEWNRHCLPLAGRIAR